MPMEPPMSVNQATRPTGLSATLAAAPTAAQAPLTASVVVAAVLRAGWTLVERLFSWNERWHQRQSLMTLDDHLLKDIGVSRLDALREAHKPVWRE